MQTNAVAIQGDLVSQNTHTGEGDSSSPASAPVEANSISRQSVELQLAPVTLLRLQNGLKNLRMKSCLGFSGIDYSLSLPFTNQVRRDSLSRLREIEDEIAMIRDVLLDLGPADSIQVPAPLLAATLTCPLCKGPLDMSKDCTACASPMCSLCPACCIKHPVTQVDPSCDCGVCESCNFLRSRLDDKPQHAFSKLDSAHFWASQGGK